MSQGKKFDEMMHGDLSLIENNARMFATITSEANQIAPLLTQSFKMRIKSGGTNPLGWSVNHHIDSLILGNWVEVTVDWELMDGCFLIIFRSVDKHHLYQFNETEFKEHVTQVGLAPRMFNAWKSTL